MATFKAGDKARVVFGLWKDKSGYQWLGQEVVVVAVHAARLQIPELCYDCRSVDGMRGYFLPEELAPLTDPGADAFVWSIKRLKPYEEPKVAPRITVSGE